MLSRTAVKPPGLAGFRNQRHIHAQVLVQPGIRTGVFIVVRFHQAHPAAILVVLVEIEKVPVPPVGAYGFDQYILSLLLIYRLADRIQLQPFLASPKLAAKTLSGTSCFQAEICRRRESGDFFIRVESLNT